MQYRDRITAIRQRATRIGAPLREVLAAGKVHPSTLMRWERPDANPRMRSLFRALDAIEGELDQRERRLVEELTGDRAA
jgi:transcriptional regulator with XRE-family HTH domain